MGFLFDLERRRLCKNDLGGVIKGFPVLLISQRRYSQYERATGVQNPGIREE